MGPGRNASIMYIAHFTSKAVRGIIFNIFSESIQYTFFLLTCHTLKTWIELSRVKLYGNDLKGNKNYFQLTGGSSYRGFKLPRVKLQ